MKLNLGSGYTEMIGNDWINVDIFPGATNVHVITDLNKPWPFKDNSVWEIYANNVFEHLDDPIFTMYQAWRVLKPLGFLRIICPSTNGEGAWQPVHKSFWNMGTFQVFVKNPPEGINPGSWAWFGSFYGLQWYFNAHDIHEIRIPYGNTPYMPYVIAELRKPRDSGYYPMKVDAPQ